MTRLWLYSILLALAVCDAAKILVVFPFPSKSHNILGEGHVRLLLEAGHEVTFMTSFPKKDPPKNLTQIDISKNLAIFEDAMKEMTIAKIMSKEVPSLDMSRFVNDTINYGISTLGNEDVQRLMNDPDQKFDVVIIEWLFTELYAGFSAVFDCPFIWFSSVEPHWIVLSLIDEALHPAYNPDCLTGNTTPFSFKERVIELGNQIVFSFFRNYIVAPKEREVYDKYFGPAVAKRGRTLPPLDVVRYNASLMLGNSHPALGQATRLPQNYKGIGGYHIESKVKPLPEDLKKIMDNAKNGVIYFSMGSNMKSKDIPDSIKRGLLEVFGELKYIVIWKFEEKLPDVPKNVLILQWAPQPSILSHPNCVLFITHGGLLSTTETIYYGVPIIGIPVFADQFTNVDRSVGRGFAKRVDLSYAMVDDLKVAIQEMLSDPSYSSKVKELSFVYHHRPVTPGAELVHWVEHVVLTRGAPHLRSPALHVPWFQKMYLDLAVLLLAAVLILRAVCRRLCCRKTVDAKKKNN